MRCGLHTTLPRPTYGIFVAITVMNSTFASSGKLAMCTTARATFSTAIIGSTRMSPSACRMPFFWPAAICVSALPMSI